MDYTAPKHKRKFKFTHEEDECLKYLVGKYGEKDWEGIAKKMNLRNARQCHDRWVYYLAPDVNTSEWTKEEEQLLIKNIISFGKKWTQIAKLFPGRNDIQIKNKWIAIKKRLNKENKQKGKKKIDPKTEIEEIANLFKQETIIQAENTYKVAELPQPQPKLPSISNLIKDADYILCSLPTRSIPMQL